MPALLVQQQHDGDTQPDVPSSTQNGSAPPSRSRKISTPTVKSKKESAPKANPPPPKPEPASTQSQMKKLTRKSSKPIINWFQRKLAGTVRARRASDGDAIRTRGPGARSSTLKEQRRRSSIPAVPPLPGVLPAAQNAKNTKPAPRVNTAPAFPAAAKRNTISLDGSDDFSSIHDGDTMNSSEDYRSSFARESLWSPTSLSVREADEDASVRPLPPSAPPSPSPSHSSSSYLSDPRTFASMAASTKPTTVLSVDLTGGMAHIAQAPPTPTIPSHRLGSHVRQHSAAASTGGSITFSALPPANSSPPSSSSHAPASTTAALQAGTLHAPQHTHHHPRNNPRPSSPPLDDASMLTLASSAFGLPGGRTGAGALAGRRSVADDSMSHFSGALGAGDNGSHFVPGDVDGDEYRLLEALDRDDDRLLEALDRDGDVDASVRALRPRSSRRGSWESEASGWSAHIGHGTGTPGTPSALRDRSLWTTGSLRTGARSVNFTEEDTSQEKSVSGHTDELSFPATRSEVEVIPEVEDSRPSIEESIKTPPANGVVPSSYSVSESYGESSGARTPKRERTSSTPKVSTLTLEDIPPPLPSAHSYSSEEQSLPTPNQGDKQSILSNQTDVFVSAPSTPAAVL
ncbi:hypothetical protein PsYK624_007560 [Phanerochaete sordida]|uniref:Uncharacterized protein n=1 Tax=Phanerochaete sordida TaxID=48140 RepID=A0A9P3FYJ1_9APHY|nr:hypothetical protein PsYK624_007560 [Phanerochaete sordida]